MSILYIIIAYINFVYVYLYDKVNDKYRQQTQVPIKFEFRKYLKATCINGLHALDTWIPQFGIKGYSACRVFRY